MKAYICTVCGYLYDDESADKNIESNVIPFEELNSEIWRCPICGVPADLFEESDSDRTPDVPSKK